MKDKINWNKWCEDNKKSINNNSDYFLIQKSEFKVLNETFPKHSLSRLLILLFFGLFSLLIVVGVGYYLVSSEYFKSSCNPELVCNETFKCEAVDCGDLNVSFPDIHFPDIDIPKCPECPTLTC